ncbi:hypothetical protein CSUB01_10482 [Colletotrichum sublineola]|uniref:Cell wall protein n=1 Tax=Colletotrichum sublineola TaxID=1173701 RepID=A0A066XLS9_COLSU|nr:hypothetical protein CSUB01_10482 [Colletotrichum sublineola]
MRTQYLIGILGSAVLLTAVPLKFRAAVEKRDNLATIEIALEPVFGTISAVDLAVVNLDGTTVAANKLYTASQEIKTTVDKATITVRAAGDLTVSKAMKLRKSTDTLAAQTKTTLDDLVSRKPILDKLGFSSLAMETLLKQEASTMALSEALSEKVPKIGQQMAASDKSNMEMMFNKAIAAYSVPASPPVAAPPVAAPPVAAPPGAAPPTTPIIVASKEAKGTTNGVVGSV